MPLSVREGLHLSTGHCSCWVYLWGSKQLPDIRRERAWQTSKSLCSQWVALPVMRFTLPGSGKGVSCCFSVLLAQSRISFSFIFLFSIFVIEVAGHCIYRLASRVGLASHSDERPQSRKDEYSLSREGS